MFNSLSDTSIFKYAESMGNNKISVIINKIVKDTTTVFVTEQQIDDALYKIRHKSFNYSAKFKLLDMLHAGTIKLIYNETIKLTVGVPYFKYTMPNGKFGVIINISSYANMKNDGTITIDHNVLYALMLSAAFTLTMDNVSSISYCVNNGMPELYTSLLIAVISRIVNVDPDRREQLKFIITKYSYIQFGIDEKRASVAAGYATKLDKSAIESLDMSFSIECFASFESLIESIKIKYPEYSTLSFASVFDRWMRSYGEVSSFAIEYMPYFVLVFVSLITNCNHLVNIKAIEREANKHSTKLITLFNKIESAVNDIK